MFTDLLDADWLVFIVKMSWPKFAEILAKVLGGIKKVKSIKKKKPPNFPNHSLLQDVKSLHFLLKVTYLNIFAKADVVS